MSNRGWRQAVREDWPMLLVLAASVAASLFVAARIREPIPLHWNWAGQVDRTAPALAAVLELSALSVGLYVLLAVAPRLDPRWSNYERFRPTWRLFRWTFVLLMVVLTWVPLAAGLGYALDTGKWIRFIIGALFLVLGNSLGQIKSTFLVGIRTPWTLSDDRVWQHTHRLAGRLWVAAGLLGMVTVPLSNTVGGVVFIVGLSAAVVYPVVFSYFDYRRLTRP
ncbi:MAG: SdpI family protein [Bacillota bacterium]